MDLLPPAKLQLKNKNFKIYGRNYAMPATFIANGTSIVNSIIAEGCTINGSVVNSVIYNGCVIEEGAVIENSVVMPGSRIDKNAVVKYAIIGEGIRVSASETIGTADDICVVGG